VALAQDDAGAALHGRAYAYFLSEGTGGVLRCSIFGGMYLGKGTEGGYDAYSRIG